MCQNVSVLTHTPSFLSWRVGLLGDSPVTCKSRGWGKCQIAHWRNACVCDMGEQETWAGAIDHQPTSSPAQSLHITGEVTWGVTWHGQVPDFISARDGDTSYISYFCECPTLQSSPTLSDLADHSLSSSSVHGILQARILEWVVMPSSRQSSWPRDWIWVFCIAGRFFTMWATREVPPTSRAGLFPWHWVLLLISIALTSILGGPWKALFPESLGTGALNFGLQTNNSQPS